MDDQEDLPQSIWNLAVKRVTETSNQAGESVWPHTQPAPDPQQRSLKAPVAQVAYNALNGPGGVCAGASTARPAGTAPEAQIAASPLVPEQPALPGAPSSPSTAASGLPVGHQAHSAARDGVGAPELASEPIPRGGMPPARAAATEKVRGRAHPMKPVTAAQIVEFASAWSDATFTLAQIARRYRCGERTVQDWRVDFGLAPRPEALRQAAKAQSILGAAAGVVDAVREAAALTQAVYLQPFLETFDLKLNHGFDAVPA